MKISDLSASLLCVCLTCSLPPLFAQPPAAGGPTYLLMSHDPVFLEEISGFSAVTYSSGHTRTV